MPAKPRTSDFTDDAEGQEAYEDALQEWKDMSPITGIFKSFSDAPGGFSEEIKEINYSIGAEYSYNQQFFLRAGYFHESAYKGNRQYFGFGAGFSLNVIRLDAAYMIATAQSSPLDQTLRSPYRSTWTASATFSAVAANHNTLPYVCINSRGNGI